MREFVSVKDFGAVGDGVTDDTAAIQAAVDSLPSIGGTLHLQGGYTYRCNSTINISKNLILVGDGRSSTFLKYYGSSTFLNQTAGDVLGFDGIAIVGNGSTAGPIAVAGSVGFKAYNNSYSQNADFIFWETVSVRIGGYYHKHFNSFFRYSKYLFTNYDQNNVAFVGCSWSNFQTGMTVQSGEGPISFVGGSIEYFADKAFSSVSGRSLCINFFGTYVENGVSAACPSGIVSVTGFYDNGTLVYTNGSEVYSIGLFGCSIFTPGIFRLVWTDTAGGCNITSLGNTFVSRGGEPLGTIFALGGTIVRANLNDSVVGSLPDGMSSYVTGLPTDLEGCQVYDPVANQWLRPTTHGWTNATLQNGFTNEGGQFANVSYFLAPNGKVKLKGVINGTSATSGTIFTLPSDFRPSTIKVFPVASVWGTGSTLQVQVYTSGAVVINGTSPFVRQIGLDGIEFYVNE